MAARTPFKLFPPNATLSLTPGQRWIIPHKPKEMGTQQTGFNPPIQGIGMCLWKCYSPSCNCTGRAVQPMRAQSWGEPAHKPATLSHGLQRAVGLLRGRT